jgi:hypothetical protein
MIMVGAIRELAAGAAVLRMEGAAGRDRVFPEKIECVV